MLMGTSVFLASITGMFAGTGDATNTARLFLSNIENKTADYSIDERRAYYKNALILLRIKIDQYNEIARLLQ